MSPYLFSLLYQKFEGQNQTFTKIFAWKSCMKKLYEKVESKKKKKKKKQTENKDNNKKYV